jgi:DNA polymerase-3 subunit delta
VPAFKPAYLIHGDDHGRVVERRARLRALAGNAWETAATPAEAAALLSSLTLALGWRFIIAEAVERWSETDVSEQLAPLMASMPAETTIAFFAFEDGRAKAPAALRALVEAAGGDISAEVAVKEWELPQWVMARAAELDLKLDVAAARALVAAVGARQQRLSRELERLSIECGPGALLDAPPPRGSWPASCAAPSGRPGRLPMRSCLATRSVPRASSSSCASRASASSRSPTG